MGPVIASFSWCFPQQPTGSQEGVELRRGKDLSGERTALGEQDFLNEGAAEFYTLHSEKDGKGRAELTHVRNRRGSKARVYEICYAILQGSEFSIKSLRP